MFIHTGADGVVWAVARVGPGARQVAGMTSQAVHIWEPGRAEPVQVLPAENDGRSHCELSPSLDGNWLVGHGGHHLYCWRRGRTGWNRDFASKEEGRCTVRFMAGAPTLNDVVLVAGADSAWINVRSGRLPTGRPGGKARQRVVLPVRSTLPIPRNPLLDDVHAGHYYAADLSGDARWFLLSA